MRVFIILLCRLMYILFIWFMKALCIFFYILPILIVIKYDFNIETMLCGFISIMAGLFLSFCLSPKTYD